MKTASFALLFLVACGGATHTQGSTTGSEGGGDGAGSGGDSGGGSLDAGAPDSGPTDAGEAPDAGILDAGIDAGWSIDPPDQCNFPFIQEVCANMYSNILVVCQYLNQPFREADGGTGYYPAEVTWLDTDGGGPNELCHLFQDPAVQCGTAGGATVDQLFCILPDGGQD